MDVEMDRKACLRAAELVEQGHCKYAAARNALGVSVLPTDEGAESWCATGALEKGICRNLRRPYGAVGHVQHTPRAHQSGCLPSAGCSAVEATEKSLKRSGVEQSSIDATGTSGGLPTQDR